VGGEGGPGAMMGCRIWCPYGDQIGTARTSRGGGKETCEREILADWRVDDEMLDKEIYDPSIQRAVEKSFQNAKEKMLIKKKETQYKDAEKVTNNKKEKTMYEKGYWGM
jgi:hypothetical protein